MEKITVRMIEDICYEVASQRVADCIDRVYVDDNTIIIDMSDDTVYRIGWSEDDEQHRLEGTLLLGNESTKEDIKDFIDLMFSCYEDYLDDVMED